ncbi:hypothetical protein LEP1GSC016_0165 [Leptospira borgpetersenii serovar Hardjo-bovis str. Sponselee]|uniref:Uncharacterized protein n=1 Tax=Leptospira borgpetersenii serovar Hardjo-bovis str. Sponselee TaxID=1303729 RepID=M6BKZ7_LEPBO|nr:hypothetical protein LEP1GSC016_0165 [Leptospira borgpetersenii serovar Hardjo-bovis str. Sponselee]
MSSSSVRYKVFDYSLHQENSTQRFLNLDLAFDGSRDRARCGIGTTGNLLLEKEA